MSWSTNPARVGERRPLRSGVALVLALAILCILATLGGMAFRSSRGAAREVDVLSGHLRALAVADAAHAECTTRLALTGWEGRWFRGGPELTRGVEAVGGTYDALVRDVPDAPTVASLPAPISQRAPGQAELIVKATWNTHRVVCVWRLQVPRDGFEELARLVPTFFGHLPAGTPVTRSAADEVDRRVRELIERRERNRPAFEDLRPDLGVSQTPQGIAAVLGAPPRSDVLDEIPSTTGGLALPMPHYRGAVSSGLPPPPAVPATGPWSDVAWRRGRGGPGADRTRRGTEPEVSPWGAWPGWTRPGVPPPWGSAPGWDGWRGWGNREVDRAGGGGFDWGSLLGALGKLFGDGSSGGRDGGYGRYGRSGPGRSGRSGRSGSQGGRR